VNRSRLAVLTAGAVLLVATVLVPATALAAGSGTLSVSPATVTTSSGTFSVDIASSTSGVNASGAAASVTFDKTKLQIVSVAKASGGESWDAAGASWAGLPNASIIAAANAAGKLPAVGAYLTSGAMPDDPPQALITVTFLVVACGDSTIGLPVGPSDGEMLDGTAGATYGDPIAVTSTSGAIVNPCGQQTPDVGSSSANITGTVDAGFLALTCPPSTTIPLVRNATNTKDLTCQVSTNIVWNLNANDPKSGPTKGHMTDGAKVLANPMHVLSGPHAGANPGDPPTWDYDQNLANGGIVGAGANTTNIALTLSQFGAPQDPAGNYGIQILFQAVNGF